RDGGALAPQRPRSAIDLAHTVELQQRAASGMDRRLWQCLCLKARGVVCEATRCAARPMPRADLDERREATGAVGVSERTAGGETAPRPRAPRLACGH